MTVRLSDQSVAFIDGLVSRGDASSRAAALDKIVRRQERRAQAEADLLRYAAIPQTDEEHDWSDVSRAAADKVWADLD